MGALNTAECIVALRQKANLTQEELAKRCFVTRQAVSKWENGEATPDTDSLKQLSRELNVSIAVVSDYA